MIDEDLYSSYHLTRRNPINRESIATLTLEKAKANQTNLKNESQKKFCSVSNSSSDLTNSQHSSSLSSQIKERNLRSSRTNIDQENNNIFSNKPGQIKSNHSVKSESKPNLSNKENTSTSQPFSANFTNSLNKLIINNGFNSLRKILKFPAHKSQNLNDVFNESKNVNEIKCYSPPVAQKTNVSNKTLSTSSFNTNNKNNLNMLKSSQISLAKTNDPIKLTDSPSSSSISRSSSIIASASSLSTPSSIMPNSKSNSNKNFQTTTVPQAQIQTLTSKNNQNNKNCLKKQHSFSSTTNAYHFSMFGSLGSESMKQNASQSKSTSAGLNRKHEHIKSLNNLPNR